MLGRVQTAIVLAAIVLLASACGGPPEPLDGPATGEHSPTGPGPAPTAAPSTSPKAREETRPRSIDRIPSARDIRIARAFVTFAVRPSATSAAPLTFATPVRLGLGRYIRATLDESATTRASAWKVQAKHFRGYLGPFSALELIQDHAYKTNSLTVKQGGRAFQVSAGDHPRCVGPPTPAPEGLETLHRVSIQPSNKSIDSCLFWFSVDLFVGRNGYIVAVTVDIWEP